MTRTTPASARGQSKALLFAIFLIGGARALFRRGNEDLGDNLAGLKDSFVDQALFRWNVEIAHRNGAFTALAGQLHLRGHRQQRYSGRRWVDHRAGTVVHHGVILILTVMRMTLLAPATLLFAIEIT